MNTITQMLHGITLGANTRLVVPYALNTDTVYQAWYDTYQVRYDTVSETVILVSHDNAEIHTPIAYMYDRYRNMCTVIFERPNDGRINGIKHPFMRITVLRKHTTKTIDAQGPIFLITETDEPNP